MPPQMPRCLRRGSLLHIAADIGHIDALTLLLEAGANPMARDQQGNFPLWDAACRGHLAPVEMLVQAMTARAKVVQTLLQPENLGSHQNTKKVENSRACADDTSDPQTKNSVSSSPLPYSSPDYRFPDSTCCSSTPAESIQVALGENLACCVLNHQLGALAILLEAGVEVDTRDSTGSTALHYAIQENSCEALELLLEADADPNAMDADGDTPLHLALDQGSPDVLEMLVDYGAHVMGRNRQGRTPYEVAQSRRYYAIAQWLEAKMRRVGLWQDAEGPQDSLNILHAHQEPEELDGSDVEDWVEAQIAEGWSQRLTGAETTPGYNGLDDLEDEAE